nr:hypothetical protein [Tanacetum cinerariifolium]
MILYDEDERLTLNMKHDTASYSNHPRRESVNLINIFNLSSEDCLEDLVSNKKSGNSTFLLHKEIASPEGEKIKEAELLMDSLDLPCDILSEYDSFNYQDFSKDDVLPYPDNEEKVFNPGILSHEKSVKIITQEKNLAVSFGSWLFEDFDPPFYELLVFKEVPVSIRLLPFSSENEEKFLNRGFTLLRSFITVFSLNYLIQDFSDSNDEFSSTDDDSFSIDNIDYVEVSPLDSELVSSEVIEIVIPEVGGINDDILLTIKDDILREKLFNINPLIDNIEVLNNPNPSSDFMTKSSSIFLNSILEETNIFDNSLLEFKTFCFDVKEISSGSTTTHSDSSLYDSFVFDLSINLFPPTDMSDFNEFADELIHIYLHQSMIVSSS